MTKEHELGDSVFITFSDENTKNFLNDIYLECKQDFNSKKDFLRRCLYLGAEQIAIEKLDHLEKTLSLRGEHATSSLTVSAIDEKIDQLYRYLRVQFKNIFINQSIILNLLSCQHNMSLAIMNNKRLIQSNLESGIYDILPARFSKAYSELLKQYGI